MVTHLSREDGIVYIWSTHIGRAHREYPGYLSNPKSVRHQGSRLVAKQRWELLSLTLCPSGIEGLIYRGDAVSNRKTVPTAVVGACSLWTQGFPDGALKCHTCAIGRPLCLSILIVISQSRDPRRDHTVGSWSKGLRNRKMCHLLMKVCLFLLPYQNQKVSNVKLYDYIGNY